MSLFGIFKKKETPFVPKGFYAVRVKDKIQLTPDSVQLIFDIPTVLGSKFQFISGQYINIATKIDGKEIRRSYSICSGTNEDLAVGIKKVKNGVFSTFAVDTLAVGDSIWVSEPMGNFQWKENAKKIVAFCAGSGITPILSIAKKVQETAQEMVLFYGNKTVSSTMFYNEIKAFSNVKSNFYFSQEKVENTFEGRLSSAILETNPNLLNADSFYLCGPQEMVENIKQTLLEKGVSKDKIFFELFEVKVAPTAEIKSTVAGNSVVTVICDQEETTFEMNAKSSVLQKALDNDVDAPYSCRGGICSTCKCKILEGTAEMRSNQTLTDGEIAEGYILSCQAYPTSEKLIVSYDA